MRTLREHLTYRWVVLLLGLIVTLLWLTGTDIHVGANIISPDELLKFLPLAIAFLVSMFPKIRKYMDKPIFGSGNSISKTAENDPIKANRAKLLEAVDQMWLSGLLDHLLNKQESLKIGLEALEPDKLVQRMGGQPYPLTDNQALLTTFDDFGHKLVLLGEPGSGKTVLMLELAKLLWNAAKREEQKRIPMIFPLASWAAKQLPFEEWLQEELHNRYGASDKLAKALVESEQIIFLLDGLDEVATDYREDCLKAIKTSVENPDRHVEYVLCSRRIEFEALQTRLDVTGEIVLKPLTMEQIHSYLKGLPFTALRGVVETNDIIRTEFAPIPFMLNTMAYVTQRMSTESLNRLLAGKDRVESLRAAFLEAYVVQRLDEKPNKKYSNAKTRHWLRWLAGQLIKHHETDFYLENMQPDWLVNRVKERQWRLSITLASSLVVGLVIGLGFGLEGGMGFGWWFALLVGLITGIGFGMRNYATIHIEMSDQLGWTFNQSFLVSELIDGLVSGLKFGLVSGLVIGSLYALRILPGHGIVDGLVIGLIIGLVVGLGFELIGGLEMGLLGGVYSQSMSRYRVVPGQGIQRSLHNSLFIIAIFGVGGGVLGEALGGWLVGLIIGLGSGLVIGWWLGLGTFIQHYTLRWMLAREGNLPFYRYDKFLDYANDLVILRKVGGGYRFTHDMLRQHLAGASAPKNES